MLASSLAWANKKCSPKELTNGAITVVLPAVVKVTQVSDSYGKSCQKMSINTVYFVRGFGKEQRVALKTTDNKHFISLPLDSPIKFRKVFIHDKGPAMLLKNLMVGKVDPDLKVEIFDNEGNKLSSTPDMASVVQYGLFQVVGLYTDIVLYAQAILNESGELSPHTQHVSVNCPAKFDIATGFSRKSQDEFKQFQSKLKKNQSTKATSDQNESPTDLVLMSTPKKTTEEIQFLEHISHLYSQVSSESKVTAAEGKTDEGATSIKDALEKLKKSSKQDNIPLVEKPVIKAQSKRTTILLSNDALEKSNGISNVLYDDASSNLRTKTVTKLIGENLADKSDYEKSLEKQKLSSPDQSNKIGALKGSRSSGSSSATPVANAYLNNDEIKSATETNFSTQPEYEWVESQKEPPLQEQGPTISLKTGDYLNGRKLQLQAEENNSTKPSAATKQTQDNSATQCVYDDVPYDTEIKPTTNTVQLRSSDRLALPLPAPPPPDPRRSKGKKHRFSLFSRIKPANITKEKIRRSVEEISDEDYVYPEEEKNSFKPMSKDVSGECKWKSASEVPKNIKGFSISDVALCLQLLNLERYAPKFRERNVDGAFLIKINKKMLIESFQMQEFEAKQLTEFATKKWRPKK